MDFAHFWAAINTFFEWRGATVLAIFVSAGIASLAIVANRHTTRQKNSIDLLFATKHDEKFIMGIDLIRTVHYGSNATIESYADNDQRDEDIAKQIRYVLNFFEHISIGIQRSIYDEKIIKETIEDMMVKSWDWSEPYINRRRSLGYPTAYISLEKLIKKWKAPFYKRLFM